MPPFFLTPDLLVVSMVCADAVGIVEEQRNWNFVANGIRDRTIPPHQVTTTASVQRLVGKQMDPEGEAIVF